MVRWSWVVIPACETHPQFQPGCRVGDGNRTPEQNRPDRVVSLHPMSEHKKQAKSGEDEKEIGLEIIAAMQEAIPRPNTLGNGIGGQNEGCK